MAYHLSLAFLGPPLRKRFPQHLRAFSILVRAPSASKTSPSASSSNNVSFWNYFGYVVLARSTPAIPNWFVSLASPHLSIPVFPFFVATAVGVSPLGWVCVRAGRVLRTAMQTGGEMEGGVNVLLTWENAGLMGAVMIVSVLPGVVQGWVNGRRNIDVAREEEVVLDDKTKNKDE